MDKKISVRSIVFVAAVILIAALTSGTRATAQEGDGTSEAMDTDQTIRVVEGGPGFVSINSAAFVPHNQYNEFVYADQLYSTYASSSNFHAALNLPDGSIINKVVLYYYDSNTTLNLTATLRRVSFSGGGTDIGYINSAGDGGYGYDEGSVPAVLVDNQNYSYKITVIFPGGAGNTVKLVGFRIDYGYSTYLPLTNK